MKEEKVLNEVEETELVTAELEPPNANAEDSNPYYRLFDSIFPESRVDILSGDLMFHDAKQGRWVSAFSNEVIQYLKTFTMDDAALKTAGIKPFLTRYLREKREREGKRLLLDIPAWDGQDRIADFARRIHSPLLSHDQISELIKEWFARTFQRLFNPKVDNTCLIFLGQQGIGKDVMIKALTSGLGQFFIPFQFQGQQKDILQALHSGVVVHIEEFDHISDKLPEAFMKMLITTSQTLFRAAFGKTQELRDARWSLIASCNRDDFLRDHTGNRRFIIVPIERIDGIKSEDGKPLAYPDGLIGYPAEEGLKILAQAQVLATERYAASYEAKAIVKSYVDRLTPVDPEKEFLHDFLEYVSLHVPRLQLVKGCYFVPTSDHQTQIVELARRYKLKHGWPGVKSILGKHGIDADSRTRLGRGLGVPPNLLSSDRNDAITETVTLLNGISNGHPS